ncbi:S26 family signal peptidase [Amycolatopsis sp. NPDC059657]|uniref:S26 family signal peptidase n=1 Tax=Amycolatopsis sp. NPDC059657 TaxID=3346899 RepID=UPI00366A6813
MRTWVAVLSAAGLAGAVRWVAGRLSAVTVSGDSMEPALSDGDRVLVWRSGLSRLSVGDIVVACVPALADRSWLIKRVAALPGDPVPAAVAKAVEGDETVPPDRLVLLSDNAEGSVDSRRFGYAYGDLVLGLVVRRLSPGR